MTTIVDLSTEPKFTIKTVASQTGIQPVTLRAWERRHDILTPYRGNNRYRLYSERDVAILRWIKYRVGEGMPIRNAVSELRSMASQSLWPEALPVAPEPMQTPGHQPPAHYARELYQALIHVDESKASDLLREAHALFDLVVLCEEVLLGAVKQLDQSRYLGQISFSVERFASGYLTCKLLSLLQVYPLRQNAPLILLGCAPLDSQELPVLMLAVLLRSQGYQVEYLGPDLSMEDLADYASYVTPAIVILSAATEDSAREMRRMHSILQKMHGHPVFAYTGRAFERSARLQAEIPGIYLSSRLQEADNQVRVLLGSFKRSAA